MRDPLLTRTFRTWLHGARRRSRAFARDTSAGVVVVVAILAPVFIGSMGLGAETGYWLLTDQKVQAAADVGAHAVAVRLDYGDGVASLQGVADYVVGNSDINMTRAVVTLNIPPTSGGYIDDPTAVQVVVTENVPRMFSKIYAEGDVPISGRATAAGLTASTACMLALNQTASQAFEITGSGTMQVTGCELVSNSNDPNDAFEIRGQGSVTIAGCIRAVGALDLDYEPTLECANAIANSRAVDDPFDDIPVPEMTGACHNGSISNTTLTPNESHSSGMNSMRFCSGLSLSGNITLDPGIYLVEGGDFLINGNANVIGEGVVFYVADSEVRFNGTADLDLTAPDSGTYNGILLYSDATHAEGMVRINGNLGSTINGAVYAPSTHAEISGNSQTDPDSCTQYVADTITLTGNGVIDVQCSNPFDREITVQRQFAVVE